MERQGSVTVRGEVAKTTTTTMIEINDEYDHN